MDRPAGYSGTPLARKLGIRAGTRVHPVDPPADYDELLEPLPEGVVLAARLDARTDLVHAFCSTRSSLSRILRTARQKLRPDAIVWISWPKKSSGVASEITEDTIREVALPLGLVDVKVCAVDATWSGLKLVLRNSLRP